MLIKQDWETYQKENVKDMQNVFHEFNAATSFVSPKYFRHFDLTTVNPINS